MLADSPPNFTVRSRLWDYEVLFGKEFSFMARLQAMPDAVWVVDERVHELYAPLWQRLPAKSLVLFRAAEENKTYEGARRLYDALLQRQAGRKTAVVAVGGGITQDVAGFVASTFHRGTTWHYVPTTLLAQADSCIGGKTSLNYDHYKNLLGTFYPPRRVCIDPGFLPTLTDLDFASGLGEVAKLLLVDAHSEANLRRVAGLARARKDETDRLLPLISESLRIKACFIEEDEFDTGRRAMLNYGHCLGHALESVSGFEVPHGVAVLAGILFAAIAAGRRGLIGKEKAEAIINSIRPIIPISIKAEHLDGAAILLAMQKDKKRTGRGLSVILPSEKEGLLKADDFTEAELLLALDELRALLRTG